MKRIGSSLFFEGLFLGIAFLLLTLYSGDKETGHSWTTKEWVLFGVALGLALGGFLVELLV